MKGLLIKDWYMALKSGRFLLIFALGFMVLGAVTGENAISPFYPMIACCTLPVSLYSLDEKSRWNGYCAGLPISKKKVVTVKYIEVAILSVSLIAISFITQGARMLIIGGDSLGELARSSALWLLAGVFSPCLMLPIVLRFGSEKGRIAYYVIIFAMVGALMAFSDTLFDTSSLGTIINAPGAIAMLLAAAALLILSWAISVKLYEGKEAY